jgi:(1->4)-alpha-D-glucan 1-alpha-D-glucosylmutase
VPAILATYRLQLHESFPLGAARELVDYLASLGVSHIHASPVFAARPGSTHGYDVTDPATVSPALGGEPALERLAAALHARDMGLVLDIVPNHMAAAPENERWEDVLRLGGSSAFAQWFDIDWRQGQGEARDRIVLPVLGDQRVRALERDELTLAVDEGEFRVRYFEHSFPVDPATLPQLLTRATRLASDAVGTAHPAVLGLGEATDAFWRMPRRSSRDAKAAERRRELAAEGLHRLRALWRDFPPVREWLSQAAAEFGRGAEGRLRLRRFLDQQPYRLVYWRRAAREINYRRFFDINELVSLHMENPEVFRAHHAAVLDWRARGWVDGFRIDHPDGLLDPAGYFERLADAAFDWHPAGRYPIWAEKILSHDERLPDRWPIAGTTGYDFLNQAEAAFVDRDGAARLDRHYRRIIRQPLDFGASARLGKRLVLETSLAVAVRSGAERLQRLARDAGRGDDARLAPLTRAVSETVIYLPVYRTYIDARNPVPEGADLDVLRRALSETRERGRAAPAALGVVADALLGTDPGMRAQPSEQLRVRFVERLQQLSGPAAAKGVEDTALYRYVPLLSRNEVGGDPGAPLDDAVGALHAGNRHRAERWPETMLAVTTHDTKRSADVRARLDVLSEVPDEWESHLYRWRRLAGRYKSRVGDRLFPDTNTTWLFFQTLVGIWPAAASPDGDAAIPDAETLAGLRGRLTAYMEKATREAKTFTSWTEPDDAYESALRAYVEAALDPERSESLLRQVARFAVCVARPGFWNSLARTALQLTSPGVPDIYQGDELWSFSLVDPDNRRAVDWELRRGLLANLGDDPDIAALVGSPEDGRIKLFLYQRLLRLRRARPGLFLRGGYEEVRAEGSRARHVIAYLRREGGEALLTVVPRLPRLLTVDPLIPPIGAVWGDTVLVLPPDFAGGAWRSQLHEATLHPEGGRLRLALLLDSLPVAVLAAG